VGARGARVRMVVNELRGEKIDIVPFSEDSPDFVAKALSPAKVKEVRIDEEYGAAEVIVPDYQLSLAIGKEGQNARLASRLSGLRIDIRSESEIAERDAYEQEYSGDTWADGEWIADAETGEQMWQPADGSPPLTLEQWQASQDAAAAAEVESEVGDELDADAAAAVEAGEDAVAADAVADESEAADEVEAGEAVAEALDPDAGDTDAADTDEVAEVAEEPTEA